MENLKVGVLRHSKNHWFPTFTIVQKLRILMWASRFRIASIKKQPNPLVDPQLSEGVNKYEKMYNKDTRL